MHDSDPPTRVIDASLKRLRSRIRRYVLLEGLAIVLAVLAVGFWLSFGLDEAHFQARKLELPRWLRIGFTIALSLVVTTTFLVWVVSRLWSSFGRPVLAMILERRFPQLNDRLMTAVEMRGSSRSLQSPLSTAMWERTAHEAANAMQGLDMSSVFDPRPLRRALLIAGVLLASVLTLGVANASGVERWFNAFILGREGYWEPYRRSAMTVHVVTEPGERRREFDEHGIYKHPRGADLTIEADSAPDHVPPDRATLSFQSFGSGGSSRGSVPMTRRGEHVFRQTLTRVIDEQHLWVTAGDFVNRTPFRVLIVEPPKLDQLDLLCDYPSYTGLDAIEDRPVAIQSVQASLPLETKFLLRGHSNKPLVAVLIRNEFFELRFGGEFGAGGKSGEHVATLVVRESLSAAPRTLEIEAREPWLSEDGRDFHVPFRISAAGLQQILALAGGASPPLPLPPVAPLQIYLDDTDGIFSADPTTLTISGIPDLDPVVDVRLSGVSNVVTRLAEIPIKGRILDDYGVARAEFGYEVLSDPAEASGGEGAASATPEHKTAPLQDQPRGQREFVLGGSRGAERFALTPLELRDGQRLQLSVYAEDADDQNGPHRARGEVFSFRIVPAEELRARLYEKELNLRQRFEQIIVETRRLRADLVEHRGRTDEWNAARSAAGSGPDADQSVQKLFNAIDACARRGLHQIRTNHTESQAIQVAFGEIRAEMVNNRVDTPSLLERIDRGVLEPLKTINDSDYPAIDGQLALFGLAMERGTDPAERIDAAREAVDRMLARMEQVLSEMQRRGDINEIIQQLQGLIDREEKLQKETEQRKFEELFEGIGQP